jgi:hypothetical protein
MHEEKIDEHFEKIKTQAKASVGKMGAVAVSKVKTFGTEQLINGGIVDALLKSGEEALGGGEGASSQFSSTSQVNAATLGALVEGLSNPGASPALGKAVPKPGASGEKGGMDFFHGGCSRDMAEGAYHRVTLGAMRVGYSGWL